MPNRLLVVVIQFHTLLPSGNSFRFHNVEWKIASILTCRCRCFVLRCISCILIPIYFLPPLVSSVSGHNAIRLYIRRNTQFLIFLCAFYFGMDVFHIMVFFCISCVLHSLLVETIHHFFGNFPRQKRY